MDLTFKKSNILVLKGVFLNDFSGLDTSYITSSGKKTPDEYSNTISPKSEYSNSTVYTKIPKRFTSVENWPKFSNLKCWICDLLPLSYPRFVPLNPEKDKDGNDMCDVLGNFCEWNCVVKYVIEKYNGEQRWDVLRLVNIIAAKFTGRRREKIMPSPDKTEMKQYCGEEGITPKQYREKIDQLNSEYEIVNFKLEHFKQGE